MLGREAWTSQTMCSSQTATLRYEFFDRISLILLNSFPKVRRQGRMGAEDNIKFPTLEVRNPNELSRGPVQVSRPPAYKKTYP